MHINSTWPVSIIYGINLRSLFGYPLNIRNFWACDIFAVTPCITIINKPGVMNNIYYPGVWYIIIIDIRAIDISLWCTYPIVVGYIVATAKCKAKAYTRH